MTPHRHGPAGFRECLISDLEICSLAPAVQMLGQPGSPLLTRIAGLWRPTSRSRPDASRTTGCPLGHNRQCAPATVPTIMLPTNRPPWRGRPAFCDGSPSALAARITRLRQWPRQAARGPAGCPPARTRAPLQRRAAGQHRPRSSPSCSGSGRPGTPYTATPRRVARCEAVESMDLHEADGVTKLTQPGVPRQAGAHDQIRRSPRQLRQRRGLPEVAAWPEGTVSG